MGFRFKEGWLRFGVPSGRLGVFFFFFFFFFSVRLFSSSAWKKLAMSQVVPSDEELSRKATRHISRSVGFKVYDKP